MALEKKIISLDLVVGGDTKNNSQIDSGYQDMENVVFTGDMTAKKMNGFDLLYQLPVGENFSQITRRQSDLLAMSNSGAYKYQSNIQEFKKISELGSLKVESNEIHGKIIGFSTNYRLYAEYIIDGSLRLSFYSHDGILINQLLDNYGYNKYTMDKNTKILHIGDDFYVCNCEFGTGTGLISFNKYKLNTGTNEFEYISTWGGHNTTLAIVSCLDFYSDNDIIYCIYGDGTTTKMMRWNSLTPATPPTLIVSFGATIISNAEIFYRDASYLYVSYLIAPAANPVHKLSIVERASMTILSTATLLTYTSINNGAGYNVPFIACYPLSDSTAIAVAFRDASSLIAGASGRASILSPLGKIFLQSGNYYIPAYFYNYTNVTNVLMKIVDEIGVYTMYPQCVSDSGNVKYQKPVHSGYLVLNSICTYDGDYYWTGYNPQGGNTLIRLVVNPSQQNNYIEIEKSNIISSGIMSYFDGSEFQEYAFLGCPQIVELIVSGGGSLAADTYQFVAIYEYTDSLGNVFYSQMSQIVSAATAASGKVAVYVQSSIMTYKNQVNLKVYARKPGALFQLISSDVLVTTSADQYDTYSFNFTTYLAATAEIAPYQDGSIQPELMTNSDYVALYADRVFTITKDDPISLSYSQMKLAYNGFEFNESTFIIDVLDKRGIAEDSIKGLIAMDGRLLVFKETSVLYINGFGPSRANTNDDFSMPQLITTDTGCTEPRSIVMMPQGVMFKSDKGIYIINRKLEAQYIGAPVERFNSYTITSAILNEGSNEVRFTTLEGKLLVYNYFTNAWSWFNDLPCISACVWNNKYTILTTDNKVFVENKTHNKIIEGVTQTEIVQKISSPWIKMDRVQGWEKAYAVRVVGFYKSLHQLKMKVFYDYELYASEEYLIDPLAESQYNIVTRPTNEDIENGTATNGVYQMVIDLIRKNCQAFRLEITDVPLDISSNTGECFALSNITLTVGVKKGAAKIQALKSY